MLSYIKQKIRKHILSVNDLSNFIKLLDILTYIRYKGIMLFYHNTKEEYEEVIIGFGSNDMFCCMRP